MTFPALADAGDDPVFTQKPSLALVYLHLSQRLDLHEFRIQKVASLARRLSLHHNTVEEALRTLCERGYLVRKPFDGRTQTYRLVYKRASLETPPSETPLKPDHSSG